VTLFRAVTVVVPCFNEAARINPSAFVAMTSVPNMSVLFVDDGSADGTAQLLENATREVESVSVLRLEQNRGKGEAVRAGMLNAIERGAEVVGYLDADGATSPEEWLRLAGVLEANPGVDAVLGSRVAMLGYAIQRRWFRHYFGRVFATFAAVAVGQRVYDTQCGAKVFGVTPRLVAALEQPFRTRWVFDVELLQRLLAPCSAAEQTTPVNVIEEPLRAWVDRPGSSLSVAGTLRAVLDVFGLIRIRRRESGNETAAGQR
jgi:dolichyl-phosphate beta-glucosyltransferase